MKESRTDGPAKVPAMKLPRIPRRWRTRLAVGLTAFGLIGGVLFLLSIPAGWATSSTPPSTVDADLADQVRDAARYALHGQGIDAYSARRLQQESPTRWQVSLVSGSGADRRCWKVEVAYESYAAAPVGQVAPIGCWPLPADEAGPVTGEVPTHDADLTARGFLQAYLSGGDLTHWTEPGTPFPLPAPLRTSDFSLLDSHQTGDQVSVNGWVRSPTSEDPTHRVDATWRVTLIPGSTGLLVAHVDAGPPPPSVDQAPEPTSAPTTSTTYPTTTTATTMPTTTTGVSSR